MAARPYTFGHPGAAAASTKSSCGAVILYPLSLALHPCLHLMSVVVHKTSDFWGGSWPGPDRKGSAPQKSLGHAERVQFWPILLDKCPLLPLNPEVPSLATAVPGDCLWGHGRAEEGAPHPKDPVWVCVFGEAESLVQNDELVINIQLI